MVSINPHAIGNHKSARVKFQKLAFCRSIMLARWHLMSEKKIEPRCSCPNGKLSCSSDCENDKVGQVVKKGEIRCLDKSIGKCGAYPHVLTFDVTKNDVYGVGD